MNLLKWFRCLVFFELLREDEEHMFQSFYKRSIMNNYTESYRQIIVPIVEKYLPDAKIILYGSRARQDFREGSDIDVALDLGCKIDRSIMSNIIGDLEESNVVVPFDMVDFYAVSEDMQKNILKDGVVWKR